MIDDFFGRATCATLNEPAKPLLGKTILAFVERFGDAVGEEEKAITSVERDSAGFEFGVLERADHHSCGLMQRSQRSGLRENVGPIVASDAILQFAIVRMENSIKYRCKQR